MEHAHGRGGGNVSRGRPGVEGPDTGQDAETQVEKDKGEFLLKGRKGSGLHQGHQVEGVQPGFCEKIDDGRQDKGAPRQQIKEKLHGRVFLLGGAPDGNQRVHGEEGYVVPEKGKEKIQRHEEPEHPGHQQEVEGKVFFYPGFQLPHGEHPGKVDNTGEKNQGQVEAAGAVEIGNARRRDPGEFFHELETPQAFVVGKEDNDREHQGDP